jgi:hypothetical protein
MKIVGAVPTRNTDGVNGPEPDQGSIGNAQLGLPHTVQSPLKTNPHLNCVESVQVVGHLGSLHF